MLDLIDFLPKVGMNYYMIESRVPTSYYRRYYDHMHNDTIRKTESVSPKIGDIEITKYTKTKIELLGTVDEYIGYALEWQQR